MIPSLGGPPPIPAACPRWRWVTRPIAAYVFGALLSPPSCSRRRRLPVLDIRCPSHRPPWGWLIHVRRVVHLYHSTFGASQGIWACSGTAIVERFRGLVLGQDLNRSESI